MRRFFAIFLALGMLTAIGAFAADDTCCKGVDCEVGAPKVVETQAPPEKPKADDATGTNVGGNPGTGKKK